MRKILSTLLLINFLVVLAATTLAQTTPPTTCTIKRNLTNVSAACGNGSSVSIEDYGMCCLINAIYNVTDWIFTILVVIVMLFVLLGAYNIITAGGSAEKVTAGRSYIMYAAIGLGVALLAKAVPSIVKLVIGA